MSAFCQLLSFTEAKWMGTLTFFVCGITQFHSLDDFLSVFPKVLS